MNLITTDISTRSMNSRLVSYPDEFDIVVISALGRSVVDAAGRELVLGVVDDEWVVEVAEDRQQTPSVPVISDSTAVVAFTRQVRDRIVRNLLILIDEHLQSTHNRSNDSVLFDLPTVPHFSQVRPGTSEVL